jgi:hypothetical protein
VPFRLLSVPHPRPHRRCPYRLDFLQPFPLMIAEVPLLLMMIDDPLDWSAKLPLAADYYDRAAGFRKRRRRERPRRPPQQQPRRPPPDCSAERRCHKWKEHCSGHRTPTFGAVSLQTEADAEEEDEYDEDDEDDADGSCCS